MRLLKGKEISEKILKDLKNRIKKEKVGPALAVVLVGENKASEIYVRLKKKAAEKVGIEFYLYKFSARENEAKIIQTVKKLNNDPKISGIIVQLPLPEKFHTQKIINTIDPKKDADGFSIKSKLEPVFPKAIVKILESIETRFIAPKKQAVVLANSKIFGETMVRALNQKKIKAEYVLAGKIKKEAVKLKNADIIITAVGKSGLVNGEMIKVGAIIIDGGITKKGKKVLGDVDFNSVKNKALYITPVPGGVGPVTIACLLENTYAAAKKQA